MPHTAPSAASMLFGNIAYFRCKAIRPQSIAMGQWPCRAKFLSCSSCAMDDWSAISTLAAAAVGDPLPGSWDQHPWPASDVSNG